MAAVSMDVDTSVELAPESTSHVGTLLLGGPESCTKSRKGTRSSKRKVKHAFYLSVLVRHID
jgi:hypothetical protein